MLDLQLPTAGPDGDAPAPTAPPRARAGRRPVHPLVRSLLRPTAILSIIVIVVVVLAAVAPDLLAHQSPYDSDFSQKMKPPSAAHWFGTDQLGRDLYSRVVHGSALTLRATLLAVVIAFGFGAALGLVAGYFRGLIDDGIMRIVDVLLAIPSLLLALAVVTALGSGTEKVAIAVGISSVATFARITRAEVLRVSNADYIEAATVTGVRPFSVLTRYILPNAAGPALVLATLEFGTAIIAVSSLSFLGFGAPLPQPEWGTLVSEGRDYLATAWWLTAIPCAVIVVVVVSTNRISRALDTETRTR